VCARTRQRSIDILPVACRRELIGKLQSFRFIFFS
jgi:hypothetical protein